MSRAAVAADRRAALGTALLAFGALATLAARHPVLRFVDLIPFAARAARLSERLMDPLYPVGYPALLAAAHALGADVLDAAKALSVLAGAGAAAAAATLVGPGAALWSVAQANPLEWSITEGTDMPAAALALGGIAAAHARRPGLAGLLAGLACLVRYTSVAALPVVLALEPRAWRTLVLAVSPHFVLAAWSGASPLPDQSANLAIGAGRDTRLLSFDTVLRWPAGMRRALGDALPDWPTRISALGLLVGIRDARARALLAWGLLHCGAVALAFSNTRLCLPAQLAFGLGAAWLVPKGAGALVWRGPEGTGSAIRRRLGRIGPWGMLAAAAVAFSWNARPLAAPDRRQSEAAAIAEACGDLQGPFLSNSPWFYTRPDGWIVGATQGKGLGDARRLTPAGLADRLRSTGARAVALEVVRLPGAMPGLVPLMKTVPPELVLVAETPTWRVFAAAPRPE